MIALLVLALPVSARVAATSPDIRVESDGSVVGRMVLDAEVDAVLAALADPVTVAEWSPSVRDARRVATGACDTIEVTMEGWVFPMRVTAERCPTAAGFATTMVESDVFREWGAEWSVRAVAGGTEVRYRLYSDIVLPVTDTFVQGKTAASMRVELAALAEAVGREG